MKFAKELERDAVPEWRVKYLNYKAGKKHVKAVARAVNRANQTPRGLGNPSPSFLPTQISRSEQLDTSYSDRTLTANYQSQSGSKSFGRGIPFSKSAGHDSHSSYKNKLQYGSFVATPPLISPISQADSQNDFSLPGPALRSPDESSPPRIDEESLQQIPPAEHLKRLKNSMGLLPQSESQNTISSLKWPSKSKKDGTDGASHVRRIFSYNAGFSRDQSAVNVQPLNLVREREAVFYDFMDHELDKVEKFYSLKERQAGERLALLREQLHVMRNRRIQEMIDESLGQPQGRNKGTSHGSSDRSNAWVRPLKTKFFPPGPNSKGFKNMTQTPSMSHMGADTEIDEQRDYIRRIDQRDVPYRTAKRKLKLALQEFYRSLELLKSYAMLNRTAFRKINKKFDKAANARPALRYVNEKVNCAWFVMSDVLDGHIKAVEDLYARYFEKGNHKLAANKLRSLSRKKSDESGSSFMNGFLIGTGLVFGIQGVIYGGQLLFHQDPIVRVHTSYLMQIYGGYFLMLLLFWLLCLNCWVWIKCKVNYPFIFEFDQRSLIDWRRLAEFPSFFSLLLGLFMWANFSRYGSEQFYLYYPVVLLALSVLIIFFPAPFLTYKSRRWFAYSHWRLLLAGIYPVEFRDFFLGDMYCSLTYVMANIELFFCLYANGWNNPVQCNSSHSRLLGFFTTLPAIWRSLQCIRRYRDTHNVFPHLVNCGKYMMTILSYVTLSCYRIDGTWVTLSLFIAASAVNSVYCCFWDLFMDFSLMQFHSKNFGLRDILALKNKWPYYTIMTIDVIFRFSWIFYAIFTHDTQHSTLVSFLVALAEILRRGLWALLRVENEHCANVSQYKASRDVPLPYRIEPLLVHSSATTSPAISPTDEQAPQLNMSKLPDQNADQHGGTSTGASAGPANGAATFRRRADSVGARALSRIIAEAHKQDFEKKRKPEEDSVEAERRALNSDFDDDEDDDASEDESDLMVIGEAATPSRRGQETDDA